MSEKKPIDITSRKSMLEHGIIVTDRGMYLKDKEEVVRAQAERILKMLDKAEALAAKAAAAKKVISGQVTIILGGREISGTPVDMAKILQNL